MLNYETLRPLSNYVFLRRLPMEITTAGGIILPGSQVTQNDKYTVLAVGPGKKIDGTSKRMKMTVKVGDIVLSRQYTGIKLNPELTWDSDIVCPEDAIEAILVKPARKRK